MGYDGDVYLTIVLNGFIHTVMYTYYFVSLHSKDIWWKSALTMCQMVSLRFPSFLMKVELINIYLGAVCRYECAGGVPSVQRLQGLPPEDHHCVPRLHSVPPFALRQLLRSVLHVLREIIEKSGQQEEHGQENRLIFTAIYRGRFLNVGYQAGYIWKSVVVGFTIDHTY